MKDFKSILEQQYIQTAIVTQSRYSYEEYKEKIDSKVDQKMPRKSEINEDLNNFCNDMYGDWLEQFIDLKKEYFDIGFMNTASFEDLYNIINTNIKVEEIVEEIVEDEFETTDGNLLS